MLTNKLLQVLLGGDEPGNEAQFCPAESLRIWGHINPWKFNQKQRSRGCWLCVFLRMIQFCWPSLVGFLDWAVIV